MTTRNDHDLAIGVRPDGAPWRVRVIDIEGDLSGPRTALVAGIWGDKPLAVMALWQLADRLASTDLAGTVTIIPAANPPAIAAATRVNPDHLYLNRVFPGSPTGPLTQQLADALLGTILDCADCVVDLHSGTATMGLGYIYDYGDVELASSFGYLPVVVGFAQPGQLSAAVVEHGGSSLLAEFGGAERNDPAVGIEGCLNVLAHRGHLSHDRSGPATVPVIDRVSMYLPRVGGILGGTVTPAMIGEEVPAGLTCWVDCPGTGERVDEFTLAEDGGLLLLANTTPLQVEPGAFGCTVGHGTTTVPVPGHAGGTS